MSSRLALSVGLAGLLLPAKTTLTSTSESTGNYSIRLNADFCIDLARSHVLSGTDRYAIAHDSARLLGVCGCHKHQKHERNPA
jgi:hypothetical protein